MRKAQGSSHNYLNAVACDSTGDCTAVGQYFNGTRFIPLSYTSSDFGDIGAVSTTLPPAQGPNSPGIENIVKDVACNSTGNCTAVGEYFNGSLFAPLSYISINFGVDWADSTTLPPAESSVQNSLASVACNSTGSCAAGGYYYNGGFAPLTSTSSDFGDNWATSVTLPLAQGADSFITNIDCDE